MKQIAVIAAFAAFVAGCATEQSSSDGSSVRPRSAWSQDPLYGAPPP